MSRVKLERLGSSLVLSRFSHPYGVMVGRWITCGLFDCIRLAINFYFITHLWQRIQFLRAYERIVSGQSKFILKHVASFLLVLRGYCVAWRYVPSVSRNLFDVHDSCVVNNIRWRCRRLIRLAANHDLCTKVRYSFHLPSFQQSVCADKPNLTRDHELHLFSPTILAGWESANNA